MLPPHAMGVYAGCSLCAGLALQLAHSKCERHPLCRRQSRQLLQAFCGTNAMYGAICSDSFGQATVCVTGSVGHPEHHVCGLGALLCVPQTAQLAMAIAWTGKCCVACCLPGAPCCHPCCPANVRKQSGSSSLSRPGVMHTCRPGLCGGGGFICCSVQHGLPMGDVKLLHREGGHAIAG
jgi:hypothetical protein